MMFVTIEEYNEYLVHLLRQVDRELVEAYDLPFEFTTYTKSESDVNDQASG